MVDVKIYVLTHMEPFIATVKIMVMWSMRMAKTAQVIKNIIDISA